MTRAKDKLEQVMWRLARKDPDNIHPSYHEVKLIIMEECGIDPKTIKNNLRALKLLGYIKTYTKQRCEITRKYISG